MNKETNFQSPTSSKSATSSSSATPKTSIPKSPMPPTPMRGRGPGRQMGTEKAKEFSKTLKRFFKDLGKYKVSLFFLIIFSLIGGILGPFGSKYIGDATQVLFNGLVTKNLPAQIFELPEDQAKEVIEQYAQQNGQENMVDMIKSLDLSHQGVDWNYFYYLLIVVLVIFVLIYLGRFLAGVFAQQVIKRFSYDLRDKIEKKIFKLSLKYIDENAKGDILSKITNDVDNIIQNLGQLLAEFLVSVVMVISILVMMFIIAWHLGIISILSVLISMIGLMLIARKAQPFFKKQWRTTGELNGKVEEYFSGHSIIFLFNHKKQVIQDFEKSNQELFQVTFKAQFLSSMIQPLMNFMGNLNYVILAAVGAIGVVGGWISLGNVQTIIMYSRGYSQPLGMIAQMMNQLQSTLASMERIYEFLDGTEEKPDQVKDELPDKFSANLSFEQVDFSYQPDHPLIQNLSLDVKSGQTVAIVGKTGAGKTTLVNLIERFYDIQKGDIKIDSKSIYDLSRFNLRENISMVLQDTWLFSGTIKENLLYGLGPNKTISDEEFEKITKSTFVDQFVSQLPEGYETYYNPAKSPISEGQKQLLTICRALMGDPEIIILDEATSSVDTRTEIYVQEAMNNFKRGRTSFVIAHRISTVQNSDLIIVMDQGSIVEQGSPEELLKIPNGFYYRLYNSQIQKS